MFDIIFIMSGNGVKTISNYCIFYNTDLKSLIVLRRMQCNRPNVFQRLNINAVADIKIRILNEGA
jgi:hypothetical protein